MNKLSQHAEAQICDDCSRLCCPEDAVCPGCCSTNLRALYPAAEREREEKTLSPAHSPSKTEQSLALSNAIAASLESPSEAQQSPERFTLTLWSNLKMTSEREYTDESTAQDLAVKWTLAHSGRMAEVISSLPDGSITRTYREGCLIKTERHTSPTSTSEAIPSLTPINSSVRPLSVSGEPQDARYKFGTHFTAPDADVAIIDTQSGDKVAQVRMIYSEGCYTDELARFILEALNSRPRQEGE